MKKERKKINGITANYYYGDYDCCYLFVGSNWVGVAVRYVVDFLRENCDCFGSLREVLWHL